jgi:hypothetical protein
VLLFAIFLANLVAAAITNLVFVLSAGVPFVILPAVFPVRDDLETAFGNNDSL